MPKTQVPEELINQVFDTCYAPVTESNKADVQEIIEEAMLHKFSAWQTATQICDNLIIQRGIYRRPIAELLEPVLNGIKVEGI